ncbi:carboxylesterase/lipase family protein [Leifsonia sp. H3M29-4]|uniref:carboxylesterase/lipase family protein n=1 Tax=Salinibacterium metalliresistens TaxID=3031321 RepID=UPI0023D9D6D7|nr:carboxylesterase/lipase family protein [Salinibacterium metalliresistens]MDF1479748.1 carboxylesterase/lipase family protein [Salinibacterium metalliresistens]
MTGSLEFEVTGGAVRGTVRRGLRMWRGIPYAAPPTGERRFRAPAAVVPWRGTRDAAEFGPIAPQDRDGQFRVRTSAPMSEDCLTLNVIAPEGPVTAAPVMVFLHGGAYSVGSAREIRRQGEGLVREGGVVFVNLNYRLGALGWLDLSSFSTPEHPIESNLGLRDQIAALAWVRDNIAAFGGDPARVTLFGESAGGNAVTTLMTVPSARGLFARAIAQSAPPNAIYPPEVTAVWAGEFMELLSGRVDDLAVESTSHEDAATLLMTASTGALVRTTTELQLLMPDRFPGTVALCPVIDGALVPERPLDAFKAGRAHPVPLIIGTNDREGSLFRGRLDILATTPPRIRAIFARTPKRSRRALKAQYPGLPARRPAADFGGDFAFWYPSVKVAERHARFAPVHMYRFDIAPRLLRLAGLDATHGLELFALFDRMNGLFGRGIGALGGRRAFKRAGSRMQRHWLRFAWGDPLAPEWPRYTRRRRRTLVFDRADRIEKDPRSERRLAWQDFVPHV